MISGASAGRYHTAQGAPEAAPRRRASLGSVIKYSAVMALILLMAPFVLPQAVGGQTLYQYVVSGSMTGSVDLGSLVVIMPQEAYAVGDVVAFDWDVEGTKYPILHRIIGRADNGDFLIKGDAATGVDQVPPGEVRGKMVLGIPYLGYLGGASRVFPLVIVFILMAPLFLGRTSKKSAVQPQRKNKSSLFLPVTIAVLVALPLASMGIVSNLGLPIAAFLLLGTLATARLAEVAYSRELGAMTDVLYMLVGVAAFSMVYMPDVVTAFKGLLGLG